MKKIGFKILAAASACLFLAQEASATPAFARQVNMDCLSCHAQNIPKLNKFGREFKLGGFTMTSGEGAQSLINGVSGGDASLPSVLNIGFITKARYHTSSNEALNADGDATGSNRGNLEIFDESAFIFGGRVAENVGTSMEFAEGLVGGKFVFSKEVGGGHAGAAYFMTDGLGAFSGMETYTTGLYRPVRMFENRGGTNAAQATGVGDGAATGIQAFYGGNNLFATVGVFAPHFNGNPGLDVGTDLNNLIRIAYEVSVGAWNVAIGGYSKGGTSTLSQAAAKGVKPGEWEQVKDSVDVNVTDITDQYISTTYATSGFDVQAEGSIADMPTFITLNMVLTNKIEEAIGNGAAGVTKENSATSLEFQINPVQNFGAKVAYLTYDDKVPTTDKNDKTATSIGLDYNYAQNVRFVVEYTMTDLKLATADDYTDIYLMSMIGF